MILKTIQLVLLIGIYGCNTGYCFPSSTETFIVKNEENSTKEPLQKENNGVEIFQDIPRITELKIFSNISNRFAHTVIRSKIKNFANVSKETTFSVVLPESAYISGFVMEIGGKNYTAFVKEKEEAKQIYDQAIASGLGAAHVAVDTRDSNVFTVSVNIEPESKAVFYLTYEELLNRQDGHYEMVINIRPGQPVKDLQVEVKISESRRIKDIKTPPLRTGNEIGSEKSELDPKSNIEIVNDTSAIITFNPSIEKQKEFTKILGNKEADGLSGQFVVQYDVERDPSGGEVLLDDGFFIHFFAPNDLKTLPKHVIFVLDTSGSMFDRKIVQLKDAMRSILDDLKNSDKFNLVEFNTEVRVWNLKDNNQTATYPPESNSWTYEESNASLEDIRFPPAYSVNSENIKSAKSIVERFEPNGGTNINDALKVALHLVEKERKSADNSSILQPLIIFLTDGEPTVGIYDTNKIISKITELNQGIRKSVIFALSFGEGADKKFLQKLALHNDGFSKHIYEAADASLQLQGFYRQISSPLLSNVEFKYVPTVTGVTKTVFPILFNGSEIIVAGRYDMKKTEQAYQNETNIALPVIAICGTGMISLKPVLEKPVTGLQRIWAYLTIKQLLEKKEISKDEEKYKKEALDLALQHSFVTPITSLVVVKPNETKTVDAESTKDKNEFVSLTSSLRAAQPLGAQKFYSPIAPSPPGYAFPAAAFAPNLAGGGYKSVAMMGSATTVLRIGDFTEPSTEDSIFDQMPWLKSAIDENGTIHLNESDYELGINATDVTVEDCDNPPAQNITGSCTLLRNCSTASSFILNLEDLKKFFCPLGKYVGVCCPSIDMP